MNKVNKIFWKKNSSIIYWKKKPNQILTIKDENIMIGTLIIATGIITSGFIYGGLQMGLMLISLF